MLIDEADLACLPPKARTSLAEERRRFEARHGDPAQRCILIVGGAGYIGGALTQYLLAHGARVRNLDCLLYHHGAAILGFLSHPRYEFIADDMGSSSAVEFGA